MGRLFARAPLAAGLGLLAGCTLFTDFGGLHDGDVSNPGIEAGSDTSADVPSVGDSAVADDAPSDVVPDGAVSPCKTAHKFCDDFDAPGLVLPGTWDSKKEAAGPLALDSVLAASSPRSLKISVVPGAGKRDSYVEKAFPTNAKVVELTYNLRVSTFSDGSFDEVDFGLLLFEPLPVGIQDQGVTIIRYPNRTVFEYFRHRTDGMYDAEDIPFNFAFNEWHHVAMKIDFSTANAVGSLRVDGATVASIPLKTSSLTKVLTQIGVNYSEDAQISAQVNVDNVTIDEL